MNAYAVDENVPIVANDSIRSEPRAPQADPACRLACIRALKRAVKSGLIVIDDAGEVLQKYMRHLERRGQPGVGDAFLKHILDQQFNRRRVRRILLTKDANGRFYNFPAAVELATFDQSDRIFVALALATAERPTILNAVDSDYSEHQAALQAAGVRVNELCPQCIRKRRRP